MARRAINPDTVYDTLQHGFSQAVIPAPGTRVLVSGQVGIDTNSDTVGPDLAEQTRLALDNIEEILSTLGGMLEDIVLLRIYVVQSQQDELPGVTEALIDRFSSSPPTATWLLVCGLAKPEWLVEIEAEAVVPGKPL